MQMTLRWFGPRDPVTLRDIRQVPGVEGVVTAAYDVPVGEPWTTASLERLGDAIEGAGLRFAVVESIPVHEEIKLGGPGRDRLIDHWITSARRVGEAGVPVVCYNFMPVFDWTRTDLAMPLPDGSTALAYDHDALSRIDLRAGTAGLPGWATAYDAEELQRLVAAYEQVGPERLWENLAYFLERVVPAAEQAGVRLAVHPDDPPWPVFGLPRILTDLAAFERLLAIVDRPANGITFCTGSLAPHPDNHLPAMVRRLGAGHRIHFFHARNVRVTGDRQFHEAPHPGRFGDVDMLETLRALRETGFDGPMRPDHGRMIWEEQGRPGYGLHDRALGAMYLQGLWEGLAGSTPT